MHQSCFCDHRPAGSLSAAGARHLVYRVFPCHPVDAVGYGGVSFPAEISFQIIQHGRFHEVLFGDLHPDPNCGAVIPIADTVKESCVKNDESSA